MTEPEEAPLLNINGEANAADAAAVRELTALPSSAGASIYRAIVDGSPDAIVTMTAEGRIITFNQAAREMFGHSPADIIDQPFMRLLPERDRETTRLAFDHFLEGETSPEWDRAWIVSGLRQDGSEFPIEISIAELRHGQQRIITAVVRDATLRMRHEEQLAHRAFHDSLTGLPNRSLFLDRLDHALERVSRTGGEVAVVFVDLNKLKLVNDTYGHQSGDALLIEVGRRIASCLRPDDTVARISGDEFTILLEDVHGVAQAIQTAEQIIERLAEPVPVGSLTIRPAASIGIAFSGRGGATPDEMLRRADAAMYNAKRSGDTRFNIYEPRPRSWLSQLEQPSERTVGRFALRYRPQIELRTGEVRGYSVLAALLDFQDRPGVTFLRDVIPDIELEEIGLIAAMIQQMGKHALSQVRQWTPGDGSVLPILGVNLPAGYLHQPDLAEFFAGLLETEGFTTDRLSISFDESSLLAEGNRAIGALHALRECGFRLGLDRFGSGQGSLPWLRHLPIDLVTLDRAIVEPARLDRRETSFLASLVSLVQSLGACVSIESGGNAEEVELLRGIGCDFLWLAPDSGPYDAAEMTRWLAAGAPLTPPS
ncbi:MAG TPA: diguanylate cyclase [Thermomicrobiaceae bacterium]|nr:diguanylate cyclase [Thermomicrobiaceae bacterium]